MYMSHVSASEYEEMYEMVNHQASGGIGREEFIQRNSAIYEGIEMRNMEVEILKYDRKESCVIYRTAFDTAAGEISFENKAFFRRGEEGLGLVWHDGLIFPGLQREDRVRVFVTKAERGELLDREGRVLAGKGTAALVGIVPGKLEDREAAVQQAAELLETEPERIRRKLEAGWVKEDSFVPVRTIPRVEEIELLSISPGEEALREKERQDRLLEIPGIMITDTQVREYPLGEAAAHLTGYVQNVTAEDLEKHKGEGYTADSVIGRSGLESLFEKELKGRDGCRMVIQDAEGNEKRVLAERAVEHGRDIGLTIDARLQRSIYEQFREDKSCTVVMDPRTGEVLALVSTPSYDSNDFVMGLSTEKWEGLNGSEDKPMFNRFRQVWCPGSTFKPIVAAVGLETGAIEPEKDYGNEGRSWQQDASWGGYFVTTLHSCGPSTLENALICSDNIYFAKAALRIGIDEMKSSLKGLGFGQTVPFEIQMKQSQYSNTEEIETQIQLADSGYGQGQILVNPLHLACMYSAFCNGGNMRKPCLIRQNGEEDGYWIPGAFSQETAELVLDGMKKVVNDPDGTGYAARREDILLAGKTGTAEVKASKEDTSGTELGWFAVFTAQETAERPILLVSMAEDVKGRGGSGYVVEKVCAVLDGWFGNRQ